MLLRSTLNRSILLFYGTEYTAATGDARTKRTRDQWCRDSRCSGKGSHPQERRRACPWRWPCSRTQGPWRLCPASTAEAHGAIGVKRLVAPIKSNSGLAVEQRLFTSPSTTIYQPVSGSEVEGSACPRFISESPCSSRRRSGTSAPKS